MVGTIEPRKNYERAIEAFARLPKEVRGATSIVIAGRVGWGGIDINEIFIRNKLIDRAYYLGYVSDDHLSRLYKGASIFLFPSLFEGFGLPVIEAMSFGIPVITSNNSAMYEVSKNAAICIDPKNIEEISEALKSLLTREDLRMLYAYKAKKRSKDFDWSLTEYETFKLFSEVMADHDSELFHLNNEA
jgi:glycosyltransferase involved in cell wall biosynthesis